MKSVAEFVATPPEAYGVPALLDGLKIAAAVELSTIPPYCCGLWSITEDPDTRPTQWIRQIHFQEMLHLGLVCNMTTAIGGTPLLVAPSYPGPLPGGVQPDLTLTLQGLSVDYVRTVFMGIEYPEDGPATPPGTATIGQLYDKLQAMFDAVDPPFVGGTQQMADIQGNKLTAITDLADVTAAITTIKEQGEGTATSPDADPTDLAHYYLFGQIANQALFVETDGTWGYTGEPVPFPTVAPMALVPHGGWTGVAPAVSALLTEFSTAYKGVLDGLNKAWSRTGTNDDLQAAIGSMFGLGTPAMALMQIPVPGGTGTYGPDFVLRS